MFLSFYICCCLNYLDSILLVPTLTRSISFPVRSAKLAQRMYAIFIQDAHVQYTYFSHYSSSSQEKPARPWLVHIPHMHHHKSSERRLTRSLAKELMLKCFLRCQTLLRIDCYQFLQEFGEASMLLFRLTGLFIPVYHRL